MNPGASSGLYSAASSGELTPDEIRVIFECILGVSNFDFKGLVAARLKRDNLSRETGSRPAWRGNHT